ncbi:hypothetical protein SAMN05444390_1033 [Marinobacterium lutimaris]|uniref:Uncharacterized protein n=1 Tax=Marinobacterium lutimaris TaxID=568106 RepID=A0A1H6BXX6_9GAMM|nr:hypothetical protein SAMN05444390_1033 [Marinobacterium lutimaris]
MLIEAGMVVVQHPSRLSQQGAVPTGKRPGGRWALAPIESGTAVIQNPSRLSQQGAVPTGKAPVEGGLSRRLKLAQWWFKPRWMIATGSSLLPLILQEMLRGGIKKGWPILGLDEKKSVALPTQGLGWQFANMFAILGGEAAQVGEAILQRYFGNVADIAVIAAELGIDGFEL